MTLDPRELRSWEVCVVGCGFGIVVCVVWMADGGWDRSWATFNRKGTLNSKGCKVLRADRGVI